MRLQPRATQVPAPFSFAPSQAFEGNDGPWSTFAIRVGIPEQVFHVLISTAGQETWVPVPEGCLSTDPSNCGALRGALPFNNQPSDGFDISASTTWIPNSLWALGLDSNLNYTGNGTYGYDTVGLELPSSGGLTLKHQIVAGIADKDFFLGMFALGPKPTNFTNFDSPQPSWMWSAKNQSLIPSLSWGYTAGAPYQLKAVPGSLTLGGYDASRFTPNNLSFSFAADDSKPLTLGLQAIEATNTFGGVMSLLPSGILTFIDSTVPEIWLPESACEIFETAFKLTYDEHTDRYIVSDAVHANLTAMSPTLTFTLGNTVVGGETIFIELPYKAFDLTAEFPIYPNATNYFPLRRATDPSMYTLGRTFLQEAYVTADYERSNFSVSQCVFKDNNPEDIVAIYPISTPHHYSGLSTGAIVAIVVAIVVFFAILGTVGYVCFRVRKRRREARDSTVPEIKEEVVQSSVPEEMFHEDRFEVPGNKPLQVEFSAEMVGAEMRHEMPVGNRLFELPTRPYPRDVSP